MKTCTKCGETKPLENFYENKRYRGGRVSRCKACATEYSRAWYKKNRGTIAVRARAYREKNRWILAGRQRSRRLRRLHGITQVEYDGMVIYQNGRCAICGMTPEKHGKRLVVDHNLETGKIRGLLCAACNRGIRGFKGRYQWLLQAARYWEDNA
ncbi:MAG: hypothetical protein KAJ19_09440 [Gammaproteobacteria bacterium]|nr:hypothetical protein [Gammaproteobacteria bacterium]